MAAWARDMPERRLDAFRLARWRPLLAAILLALLGVASLAIVERDVGDIHATGEDFWLAIAAYFILAMALVGFWLAWRRPVLLRVGPEGLQVSPGYRRPFPWADIRGLRYTVVRSGLFHRFHLLEVDLDPEAEIPVLWHNRWLAGADRWFAWTAGVRVPIWLLDASADEIVASIERFHPVKRKT